MIGNFARTRSSQLINASAIGNVSYTAPTLNVGEGWAICRSAVSVLWPPIHHRSARTCGSLESPALSTRRNAAIS
jgi:hypothetical protein